MFDSQKHQWPDRISDFKTQNLLSRLLCQDDVVRLGGMTGSKEIMAHSYFQKIDWALVRRRCLKPPKFDKVKDMGAPTLSFNLPGQGAEEAPPVANDFGENSLLAKSHSHESLEEAGKEDEVKEGVDQKLEALFAEF
jgi:hypothetical protein